MTSIKQAAQAYEPPQTRNIAELDKVNINEEVLTGKSIDKDDKEFTYFYIDRNGVEYRMPNSVLAQLKLYLEVNENMTWFKVVRKGEGMSTKYTVMPLGMQ